jgi:thiopeptide-type bacteriocin biosynthesis protein
MSICEYVSYSQPNSLAEVIDTIYPVLNSLLEQNSVWKIQTDTYQREIERYGKKTIEDSETLFGMIAISTLFSSEI